MRLLLALLLPAGPVSAETGPALLQLQAAGAGAPLALAPVPGIAAAPDFPAFLNLLQDPAFEDLEKAIRFRQTQYRRRDPDGDLALLTIIKRIHGNLSNALLGGPTYRVDRAPNPLENLNKIIEEPAKPLPDPNTVEGKNARIVIEGDKNPIKRDEFLQMFSQILYEEARAGLPPKYGEIHEWSPEFEKNYKKIGNHAYLIFTKLLVCLSSGLTYRFMMTEKEVPLVEWILRQPDSSIRFHELFRQSYRLNGGDVYLTLLTCENILAEFWREPRREQLAVTRKLAPIINAYQDRGDKYGSWYHLFGIMLYGYATNEWRASRVAFIESQGGFILDKGKLEPQEAFINSEGAVLGARLQTIVKDRTYERFKADRNYADPAVYLDLTEDFRDRIHLEETPGLEARFWFERVSLKSLDKDYLNCKVEVMPDYGWGPRARYTMTWDGRERLSFPKGKRVIIYEFIQRGGGHTHDSRPRGFRLFLSGCAGGLSAAAGY